MHPMPPMSPAWESQQAQGVVSASVAWAIGQTAAIAGPAIQSTVSSSPA
jgi:hypothetical protein